MRRQGLPRNYKREHRVYCALELNLPRRTSAGCRCACAKQAGPAQNAYIEQFNRSYRHQVFDAYLFGSIEEAQAKTDWSLEDYNTERPHDSLGDMPPHTLLPGTGPTRESSFDLSN